MDRKSKKKKKKQQQRQDVESVRKGGGDEESSGEPDSDFRFKRLKERYVSHSFLGILSLAFQITRVCKFIGPPDPLQFVRIRLWNWLRIRILPSTRKKIKKHLICLNERLMSIYLH